MINEMMTDTLNRTETENGAMTYRSTNSDCLDLFSTIGALRSADEREIEHRFAAAFAENPDLAMKILFFARDVRGGLGERRTFRVLLKWLAQNEPNTVKKNLSLIAEFGRYDDLLILLHTPCEEDALDLIRAQLMKDAAIQEGGRISLLAKWLPSVNASSSETVRMGKYLARNLGMNESIYRKTLSNLRKKIRILENHLRLKDYTFDYEKQPSRAMLKYRAAFLRNDKERYGAYLEEVRSGKKTMHTAALMPYDIIRPLFNDNLYMKSRMPEEERRILDATWNALPDFGTRENALVVIDGSGSMYNRFSNPLPIAVAISLGIYFAERNTGAFQNSFITFSAHPRLVQIKGRDICEKVNYCAAYNEIANTNLEAVFRLILKTALKNSATQEELPTRLYIVSDMEFDQGVEKADKTNFELAKEDFEAHGYRLPEIVFWNVENRNRQQPVKRDERGVALISGCSPALFSMLAGGICSPYKIMLEILGVKRYAEIAA